jgi:hypothetical protein
MNASQNPTGTSDSPALGRIFEIQGHPNRPKKAMQASSKCGFFGDIVGSYCSAVIGCFGQLKTWQIV